MLVRDANLLLNRFCVVSFRDSDTLLKLSLKHGFSGIAKIRMKADTAFIITNIPKDEHISSAAAKDLLDLGFTESTTGYRGTWDKSDQETVAFFREVISVPSVVIDAVIVESGFRVLLFRFHEVDAESVSALLTAKRSLADLSIRYFGPNAQAAIFRHIQGHLGLKYYEISTSVPPEEMDLIGDPVIATFGSNWTREVKYLLNDDVQAVYHEKNAIIARSKMLREIYPEQKLYEMTFKNPLVTYIFSESTKAMISLLGMQHSMFGKEFRIGIVVPEAVDSDFMQIISSLVTTFKKWKPAISAVCSLESALSG